MSTKDRKRAWPTTSGSYDECQTPPYALDALTGHLLPNWNVWEPFAGEGLLVEALQRTFYTFSTSLQADGKGDFFTMALPTGTDVIISNPPYSRKYEVLERCYQLKTPFALLMPGEMMFADRFWQTVDRHGRGIHVRVVTPRINFKMPNLGWLGSGAQFPTAWYCHRLAELFHGEVSRFQLSKGAITNYHIRMRATQLPIMPDGGYNHIINLDHKGKDAKPSLCKKHFDIFGEVRAVNKPVDNLCPKCEEIYDRQS